MEILLQYHWYYGGPMEQMISQWAQLGVFNVLLPFLLVFAVVFAILEKIDLLKNRGVHAIISLAVGFFTIANPYVISFFLPLFSNLGLGVAILIALVVVLGLAIHPGEKTWKTIFLVMGVIIFIVVLGKAGIFNYLNIFGYCDSYCQSTVVFFVIVGLAVLVALLYGKKEEGKMIAIPAGK
ncbi:MAG: hypothetical protein NZ889_00325 [Candidatus Pacearchaeota archaeon]|nr:hypothetical protein [Candidatus Pacearchaeota archaeon]